MHKFLLVGDIHARDKAPRGATEPYLEDLLDLLRQTVKLAEYHEVDAVVWAGDVFHEKDPRKTSHATVQRMIEIVQSYTMPLYIVPGNHDISNDRLDSIDDKQPLGVLYRAGAIRLDGWARGLPLFGVPWQSDWHEEGTIPRAFAKFRDPNYEEVNGWAHDGTKSWGDWAPKALTVTHVSLYPPGEAPPFDVLDIHEVASAMGGVGSLYYGHIHEDHGIYDVDGVTFANMGALSRGSRHEYNVTRDIKVCLWDEGTFEEVVLDYKPAEEVLLMEEHHDAKSAALDLNQFLESIGTRSLEISSTGSVVDYIKSRTDVEKPVRERAINLLEGTG